MSKKLDRLAAEREKARIKREEWNEKYEEWDAKYKEQENEEIHEMVHAANLTLESLADLIRHAKTSAPDPDLLLAYENREE